MSILSRLRPNAAKPAPIRRESPADRALTDFKPPRRESSVLPIPNGKHVPVPRESENRRVLQLEARTAARDAAARVAAAEVLVQQAEVDLTVVRSRARFGDASAFDVRDAQAAVDAAHVQLRDAKRNANGGITAALEERKYREQAALIEANAERQAEALRGLATCVAEELQLERDLATVRQRRKEFEDAIQNVTFVHRNEQDTPVSEHAQHLIARVKTIVVERLGLTPKPVVVGVRYSPLLERRA